MCHSKYNLETTDYLVHSPNNQVFSEHFEVNFISLVSGIITSGHLDQDASEKAYANANSSYNGLAATSALVSTTENESFIVMNLTFACLYAYDVRRNTYRRLNEILHQTLLKYCSNLRGFY